MISREMVLPIDRTKLSKALLTDESKAAWRSEEHFKEGGVEIVYSEVKSADFDKKIIKTDDGKEYSYNKLILASGGTPKYLPIDGLKGDLGNVFLLRSLEHTKAITSAAGDKGGKNIIVIGSSFIGMEVGNCLANKKHDVTIVGMESTPLEKIMGSRVGAIFRRMLEKSGVKFYMNANVSHGSPSSTDSSKIGSVHLKDGTVLSADLVIEGVGVRPSTDYLQDSSQITLEKDGSLSVDEYFQVKGHKDVYAIGDIATYPYHGPDGNGKPVRIEHWDVAQNAGRVVASRITGSTNTTNNSSKDFIPVFWSALGAQLRYCGHTPNGFDDVIIKGNTDVEKPSWSAFYIKDEKVVAVATMGNDPVMSHCAELMRVGGMPGRKEIESGLDVLTVGIKPLEAKI